MNRITVLGAGSWGTALARMLAERGAEVQFWGRDAPLMEELRLQRINARYLPGVSLPEEVLVTSNWAALKPADATLVVVPSKGFHSTLCSAAAAEYGQRCGVMVSCTKGIELHSGLRMSELMHSVFPGAPIAVLSGPNHAEEVVNHLPTAAVVACEDDELGQRLQGLFTLPWFRSYRTQDVVGVEWAGALKNVYAIASGIAEGLALGDNAIAALVTRALAEMIRFGNAMGGQTDTFVGLSGLGDLVATCFSAHSRNHRVGVALGRGESLESILSQSKMVAEGVGNTESLHQCARRIGARTPLLDAVHGILYEGSQPREVLRELFARDARRESD